MVARSGAEPTPTGDGAAVRAPAPARRVGVARGRRPARAPPPRDRPEYYDFDLFRAPPTTEEWVSAH